MDDKLKGFFDTATQKAQADAAQRKAADEKRAAETAVRAENGRLLEQQVEAELGGILFILKSLPEKDGCRFEVANSDQSLTSGTRADRFISIGYQGKQHSGRHSYDYGYDEPRPSIGVNISLDTGGTPDICVTQYAIMEYERHSSGRSPRRTRCSDYETLRQTLGEAVAHIAASRLGEIGEAMSAQQTAVQQAAAPETGDQTRVFARPLQFRNAAQPQTAEPVSAPPAAPEKQAAPAKPFWQRILRL